MSVQFNVPTSGKTKRIDLSHLPVTQTDRSTRGAGVFLVIFSCFWGGIPAAILIKSAASGTMEPGLLYLILFVVIGLGIFMGGLYLLTASTTTSLSLQEVRVSRRSVFGTKEWRSPLSAFTGVRSRREYHSGSDNSPSYTLYLVELLHSDPKKTVRLYESRGEAGHRRIWEDACRALGLPAVEGDGANLVLRAAGDLDKSVKDLAREGKLHVEFDPAKAPPPGLSLKVDGHYLELSVKTRNPGSLLGLLIALIVPGIFIYVGFFVKGVPVFFGIVGLIFMLIFGGGMLWTLLTTEQIRVAKDEIHVRRLTPWGPMSGTRLDCRRIEVVRIGKKDEQGEEGVLIESDAGITLVGSGLPDADLEWLKNCILKIISA